MKIKSVSISEVQNVAVFLAKELMEWNEPIPEFDTRFPSKLESCLAAPFQMYAGRVFYKGLVGKASAMFYFMIKSHPFKNGNKRIAITTLLYLLYKNKKWIQIDNTELYNFAKWVTESNSKLKNETIKAIEKFVSSYLMDVKK